MLPPSLRASIALLAVVVLLGVAGQVSAASPDAATSQAGVGPPSLAITLEPFAAGLSAPVFVTGDGSGSGTLYAVEQAGTIRAISPAGVVQSTPFLDISDHVAFEGERGLLGLAFHPDYAANGRLFVDYTRSSDGATTVSEFHATDGAVDSATERVLLTIPQPFPNHNGGMVAFDATGKLLIGMGDGGSGGDPMGNGQDRDALLGKLLRIDVDGEQPYAIPADNPFIGVEGTRPEIFTVGMRNPWRFSVDRETGDVFIGDVGQDLWEEVDVVPAGTSGQDFGWNITEGPDCYGAETCDRTGLTAPVAVFPHSIGDCTVIGGYVYRGSRYPALQGAYVFGDYCSGVIRVLTAADAVQQGTAETADVGRITDGQLVAFGQGDNGELYAVEVGGRILHIAAAPPD